MAEVGGIGNVIKIATVAVHQSQHNVCIPRHEKAKDEALLQIG
jgi:hypothetical protein